MLSSHFQFIYGKRLSASHKRGLVRRILRITSYVPPERTLNTSCPKYLSTYLVCPAVHHGEGATVCKKKGISLEKDAFILENSSYQTL